MRDANYMDGASHIPESFKDSTKLGRKADVVAGDNQLEFDMVR